MNDTGIKRTLTDRDLMTKMPKTKRLTVCQLRNIAKELKNADLGVIQVVVVREVQKEKLVHFFEAYTLSVSSPQPEVSSLRCHLRGNSSSGTTCRDECPSLGNTGLSVRSIWRTMQLLPTNSGSSIHHRSAACWTRSKGAFLRSVHTHHCQPHPTNAMLHSKIAAAVL